MLALICFLLLLFFLPAVFRLVWWCRRAQRLNWYGEDCRSAGLLPDPATSGPAVYVLSARTSGLKGALATHSWVVIRKPGATTYERYDKMGWGDVIWKNGFAADGRWFGHHPVIERALLGPSASAAIPAVEAAIASYPHQAPGAYRAWPGPNSNSFVAHVMRAVPELGRMPATAVGRDFARGISLAWQPQLAQWNLSLTAYCGVTLGWRVFELRLLGLVGGVDLDHRLLLVPGIGAYALRPRSPERADRSDGEHDALAATFQPLT